jgi:predicted nucleic acid-binding protein
MKLYLDNCCYNRPYDEQNQVRVELETIAKLYIQDQIKKKNLSLVVSFILVYENAENPDETNRNTIAEFLKNASEFIDFDKLPELTDKINELLKMGLKWKDAAHLACAIEAGCDYLLTTDDKFQKRYTGNEITVCNPVDFIKLLEGDKNA